MMRRSRTVPLAFVAAGLLVVSGLGTAFGYIQQRQTQVLLSGPNVVRCDRGATISARVVSTEDGKPIANQIVRWSLAAPLSGGDGLSAASTISNGRGRTSVGVSFGPVAGPRTIRASIAGGAPTVTVRCAGGLPRTSPLPPTSTDPTTDPDAAAGAAIDLPATHLRTAAGPWPASAIRIERLGIDLPLVEGDGIDVADGVAAHYPGSAWPGQGGNTFVYSHARAGQFLELWQVRAGDRIDVDLADGSVATYAVTEIHPVVPWDALEYLEPADREILTLQTCLEYEDTTPRFIVIADRVNAA